MSEWPGLPPELVRAVDLLVDSLDGLELLILVAREPDQLWAPARVAERLRVGTHEARRALDRMRRRGLVVVEDGDGDDAPAYRFAPADEQQAAAANDILSAYGNRRIELINHVAARAFERMLSATGASRPRDDS